MMFREMPSSVMSSLPIEPISQGSSAPTQPSAPPSLPKEHLPSKHLHDLIPTQIPLPPESPRGGSKRLAGKILLQKNIPPPPPPPAPPPLHTNILLPTTFHPGSALGKTRKRTMQPHPHYPTQHPGPNNPPPPIFMMNPISQSYPSQNPIYVQHVNPSPVTPSAADLVKAGIPVMRRVKGPKPMEEEIQGLNVPQFRKQMNQGEIPEVRHLRKKLKEASKLLPRTQGPDLKPLKKKKLLFVNPLMPVPPKTKIQLEPSQDILKIISEPSIAQTVSGELPLKKRRRKPRFLKQPVSTVKKTRTTHYAITDLPAQFVNLLQPPKASSSQSLGSDTRSRPRSLSLDIPSRISPNAPFTPNVSAVRSFSSIPQNVSTYTGSLQQMSDIFKKPLPVSPSLRSWKTMATTRRSRSKSISSTLDWIPTPKKVSTPKVSATTITTRLPPRGYRAPYQVEATMTTRLAPRRQPIPYHLPYPVEAIGTEAPLTTVESPQPRIIKNVLPVAILRHKNLYQGYRKEVSPDIQVGKRTPQYSTEELEEINRVNSRQDYANYARKLREEQERPNPLMADWKPLVVDWKQKTTQPEKINYPMPEKINYTNKPTWYVKGGYSDPENEQARKLHRQAQKELKKSKKLLRQKHPLLRFGIAAPDVPEKEVMSGPPNILSASLKPKGQRTKKSRSARVSDLLLKLT